jgi:hypothetical protein
MRKNHLPSHRNRELKRDNSTDERKEVKKVECIFFKFFVSLSIKNKSMETLIIQLQKEKKAFFLSLLQEFDFIEKIEELKKDFVVIDEYVTEGKPMSIQTLQSRISQAESEDEMGLAIADEDLVIEF